MATTIELQYFLPQPYYYFRFNFILFMGEVFRVEGLNDLVVIAFFDTENDGTPPIVCIMMPMNLSYIL